MKKAKADLLLMRVPNTEEGKQFLKQMKKYLNADTYYVKVRGRHPNRKEVMVNAGVRPNSCRDIPVNLASELAVYVNRKDHKFYMSWKEVNDHVENVKRRDVEWLKAERRNKSV